MILRGLFSIVVNAKLFISDAQYYMPFKLCRTAGNMYLFNVTGKLTPEYVKLRKITY